MTNEGENFYNLSGRDVPCKFRNALNLGPSFVPRDQLYEVDQLYVDLHAEVDIFARKVNTCVFFSDSEGSSRSTLKFRSSSFRPPVYPIVESCRRSLHHGLNVRFEEVEEVGVDSRVYAEMAKEFANGGIVALKPDKAKVFALLPLGWVLSQIRLHLSDSTTYELVSKSKEEVLANVWATIEGFVDHWEESFDEGDLRRIRSEFQHKDDYALCIFKIYPKVLKSPLIKSRPVSASHSYPMKVIGKWFTPVLQQWLSQARTALGGKYTVLVDTPDLIRRLEKLNSLAPKKMDGDKIVLVKFDFASLYTRMTFEEIKRGLVYLSDLVDPPLEIEFILAALQLLMENSFFIPSLWDTAEKPVVRQQVGLPMGMHSAPEIANAALAGYEVYFFEVVRTTARRPLLFGRLIDDGLLVVWASERQQRLADITAMYAPHHKFDIESGYELVFLDLQLTCLNHSGKGARITFTTHLKDRKVSPSLHFSSDHPRSLMAGLVVSTAFRLARNNSCEKGYLRQLNEYLEDLCRQRGYTKKFLSGLKLPNYEDRRRLLQGRKRKADDVLSFAALYTRNLPPSLRVGSLLQESWKAGCSALLPTTRPVIANRRGRNLEQLLRYKG